MFDILSATMAHLKSALLRYLLAIDFSSSGQAGFSIFPFVLRWFYRRACTGHDSDTVRKYYAKCTHALENSDQIQSGLLRRYLTQKGKISISKNQMSDGCGKWVRVKFSVGAGVDISADNWMAHAVR